MMVILSLAALYPAAAIAQPSAEPKTQFDLRIADAMASMLVDPAKTIEHAKAAQLSAQHLQGAQRLAALATAKWLQGEAYLRLNDAAHAGPMIDEAFALAKRGGPPTKLNGDILLSKGGYDTAVVKVADALAAYQQAYNIFRNIGETRSESIALISIAYLYQQADDWTTSLKYYDQALQAYHGDPNLLFSIRGNRSVIFSDLKRFPEAQAEFSKALTLAHMLKSPMLEARTLRNLAREQLNAGQIAAADRAIVRGFRVARGDDTGLTAKHFLVLSARSAQLHGRLGESARLIDRVFAGMDLRTTPIDFREGHLAAYEIYKKTGKSALALSHLEALKRLEDETSKLATSANTALAAARFDFANQQLNLEKLKRAALQRNIDDAKLRARTQLTIFGGLAVATLTIVALLALGLVTLRRSRNELRAANSDLASTNGALGKALAAKTEFLATTSHEIRTPLNGILGMTQVMLADRGLSDALRDRLGIVHGAGVTMRALVDDILDIAKMETGNLTIECAPFNLAATLRDVSRLWEEQAHAKGIGFALDLGDCPHFVEGDAARLRQIVFNLLSNALKFTATGTVTMRAASGGNAAKPTLDVTVRDSGIGIPADKLDMIFESFRQADAGTTRKFGGTGLGLAICRNLARAMDGDVTVSSAPGAGSCFTLTLPLLLAAPPAAADPVHHDMPALLILDRNPIARAMLRAVLEGAGAVSFAGSVEEAIARIGAGGVARVLVDDATLKLGEPERDLRALAATGVAVVLLWPVPSVEDAARFVAAGVTQVIAKPIAGNALAASLFQSNKTDNCDAAHLVTQAA